MQRLWLITNPGSGSAGGDKCAAIEAVCEERGLTIVGRTLFPDDRLPDGDALDEANVDTVMLFAGDGTINAAACKLDTWGGRALILPGGTMNLLAKRLHGDAEPQAIVHAAHACERDVTLPFVEAGPHRAFVGLIVGPAATWQAAREIVRKGRLSRLGRAIRLAWARSWGRGIAVYDGRRLRARCRAVYVAPADDDALTISAISAEGWADVLRLGWDWLTGDWHAAPAVDDSRAPSATLVGRRTVHALFDGEAVKLPSPVAVMAGHSRLKFIATRAD